MTLAATAAQFSIDEADRLETLKLARENVRTVLGPFEISRMDLPALLMSRFVATDKIMRALAVDIERDKLSLGSTVYLCFGKLAQTWIDMRARLSEPLPGFSPVLAEIENLRKRALAMANELLSRGQRRNASTVQGAVPASKQVFTWKRAILVGGSVAALWACSHFYFDRLVTPEIE